MLVAMDVLLVLECNRDGYDSPVQTIVGFKSNYFQSFQSYPCPKLNLVGWYPLLMI